MRTTAEEHRHDHRDGDDDGQPRVTRMGHRAGASRSRDRLNDSYRLVEWPASCWRSERAQTRTRDHGPPNLVSQVFNCVLGYAVVAGRASCVPFRAMVSVKPRPLFRSDPIAEVVIHKHSPTGDK